MAKIKIETSLKSKENSLFYAISAIQNINSLQYKENDFLIKIDITDNCVKMLRKNSEYEQKFHFEKGNSNCLMIFLHGTIEIPIYTKELFVSEDEIRIIYLINDEEYDYLIKIKEV